MGAKTPEELEALLEDAFVLDDADALRHLFEPAGVFARHCGECTYFAGTSTFIQARDIVLTVGPSALGVMRRGPDGHWRYAILTTDETAAERGPLRPRR